MSEGRIRLAIGVLALAGVSIAGYLTFVRFSEGLLLCASGGCETVQSSRYAVVLGVPVAVLGLGGYLLILASAFARGELARVAGASIALAGFGFSTYLIYVQLALIGAVCQWCVASDVIMTLIAGLAVLRLEPRPFTASACPR